MLHRKASDRATAARVGWILGLIGLTLWPVAVPAQVGPEESARRIKPAEGLDNPVNLMLYAWVQGYVSAANVALLEYDAKHLDMSELTDTRVLGMLQDYCKAHPDRKPANALDAYIKTTKKLKTQWTTGTVQWDE